MAGLIDQFGNSIAPAEIARLREMRAGPTLAGVRPVVSGSPAEGMTPARLAAIHRMAVEGNSLAYMELAEDIEERDLHYAAVLGTRKRQVAQLPIQVEAASDDAEHVRHADFVREWIKTGVLEAALFDMLDAVGKGFSVHEIEWDVRPGAILPRELVYRSPRWFEVSRADGETVLLRDLASASNPAALLGGLARQQPAAGLLAGQVGLEPLMPHKFVVHRHKAKSGMLVRSGLARLASWAWMAKAFTLRDWAVFAQNYGAPIRVGRYGPDASAADRDVLWEAVANIAGDCAAIIPKSMEIEFQEVGNLAAGSDLYHQRADWLDQQVSKAVLGQTTTTDAISGGHAVSQEHRLVQEDIERADARLLSGTVTRQLAALIVAFNFPGATACPKVRIGRPDELPIKEVVNALQWLGPQGLTVETSEIRDRLGFSEPEPDADVVGGKPPPPPPPSPTMQPGHVIRTAEDARGPGPAPKGQQTAAQASLPALLARHTRLAASQVDPELIDAMTVRLARDAQGAMAGLTDEVRAVIDRAESLEALAAGLEGLKLDTAAFTQAMGRGLAVAHLAGQAALLDELAADGR